MPKITSPQAFLRRLRQTQLVDPTAKGKVSPEDIPTVTGFIHDTVDFLEPFIELAQKKAGYAGVDLKKTKSDREQTTYMLQEMVVLPILQSGDSFTDSDKQKLLAIINLYQTLPFHQRQLPQAILEGQRLHMQKTDDDLDAILQRQHEIRQQLVKKSKGKKKKSKNAAIPEADKRLLREYNIHEKRLTSFETSANVVDNLLYASGLVKGEKDPMPYSAADITERVIEDNKKIHTKLKKKVSNKLLEVVDNSLVPVLDNMRADGIIDDEKKGEIVDGFRDRIAQRLRELIADDQELDDLTYASSENFINKIDYLLRLFITEELRLWMVQHAKDTEFELDADAIESEDVSDVLYPPFDQCCSDYYNNLNDLKHASDLLANFNTELQQFLITQTNAANGQSLLPNKHVQQITDVADWFQQQATDLMTLNSLKPALTAGAVNQRLQQIKTDACQKLQQLSTDVKSHPNFFKKMLNAFIILFTCGCVRLKTSTQIALEANVDENQQHLFQQQIQRASAPVPG